MIVYIIRCLTTIYFRTIVLLVLQTFILILVIFGNFDYGCEKIRLIQIRDNRNATIDSSITGAGQLGLFIASSVEDIIKLKPNAFRVQFFALCCEYSVQRYLAFNLICELVDFWLAFSMRFFS